VLHCHPELLAINLKPSDPKKVESGYFALQVLQYDIMYPYELKKCCKKYKKGKRCKKCPAN